MKQKFIKFIVRLLFDKGEAEIIRNLSLTQLSKNHDRLKSEIFRIEFLVKAKMLEDQNAVLNKIINKFTK